MAKAEKIKKLHLNRKLDRPLKRILLERYEELKSFEAAVLKAEDSEAVHSMRVSSRRLQAVLKTFQEAFSPKKFKKIYSYIRTLKNVLGEVRNCDAFIEKLETYRVLNNDEHSVYLLIERKKMQREKKKALLDKVIHNVNKVSFGKKFKHFIKSELY